MTAENAKTYYYKQWEKMPGSVSEWQNGEYERNHPGRQAVADIVKRVCGSVLDVACGIGIDYTLYHDLKYFGVDITPKFVEEARRKEVPCQVASALNLPFPNSSFDAVICKDLLLHLPPGDWRVVLAEMMRVAAKMVVVLDTNSLGERTKYMLCESYNTQADGKGEDLLFFNNVYSQKDFAAFAGEHRYDMKVRGGGSVRRFGLMPGTAEYKSPVYMNSIIMVFRGIR